jgi:hypothetical protein
MMLGMPASSSMAMPSGRFSHVGHSSVMNSAMPKPIGTPNNMAMIDVMIVPAIGAAAPNCSVTGFQTSRVRKLKPNSANAGAAPMTSDRIMPPSKTSTATDMASVAP